MVRSKTNSDQNTHQKPPDCTNHFKNFAGSMPPNPLACVQLISVFLYESGHFSSEFFQNINQTLQWLRVFNNFFRS